MILKHTTEVKQQSIVFEHGKSGSTYIYYLLSHFEYAVMVMKWGHSQLHMQLLNTTYILIWGSCES